MTAPVDTFESEFRHPCPYCGTMLNDDEQQRSDVPACGPRMMHYAEQCREYVKATLDYKVKALEAEESAHAATRTQLAQAHTLLRDLERRIRAWLKPAT